MMPFIADTLTYFAFLGFATKRLMTYLMALQQDDYDNGRLLGWIGQYKVFDKMLSATLFIITGISIFNPFPDLHIAINALLIIAFIAFTILEKDARKAAKKKLVMTQRATRIFFAAVTFTALFGGASFTFGTLTWPWILLVQAIPLCLILGNLSLVPYENTVQKKFWQEAHDKVMDLNPTVIGITGSFGKTSVKHILGHILKMQAPTLVTPGSVNTPMGITRIIREQLEPTHKYFIVEMGAYGPGSIDRLCKLTPPDMGLITAIGHAHYERFKTLDTVAQAKFELAQAVMDKGGKTIVHERTLRFDHTLQLRDDNQGNFIVCGEPEKDTDNTRILAKDSKIMDIKQTIDGLSVKLHWKGQDHIINAPLYGMHHGHNLAMAFTTALDLGLDVEAIHAALKTLPQIQHRLEVKKLTDGTTIIDDAFNSNPIGFHSAIELSYMLKNADPKNPGRAILVTPGMVELGNAHNDAHDKIGTYAAKMCDIAVIVQGERIPSFIKAFKKDAPNKTLIEVASFSEASAWVEKHKASNDIILIENDLPDLYERVPQM